MACTRCRRDARVSCTPCRHKAGDVAVTHVRSTVPNETHHTEAPRTTQLPRQPNRSSVRAALAPIIRWGRFPRGMAGELVLLLVLGLLCPGDMSTRPHRDQGQRQSDACPLLRWSFHSLMIKLPLTKARDKENHALGNLSIRPSCCEEYPSHRDDGTAYGARPRLGKSMRDH
jgi:hypothetical protein